MTASASPRRICACAAPARSSAPASRARRSSSVATPEQVTALAPVATDDARLLIDRDGGLESERGQAARLLLYLMERDAAVGLLRGG